MLLAARPLPKRSDWVGAFTGKRSAQADIKLKNPIRQGGTGGSRPFLAAGEDGASYWVKVLNNPQGPTILCSEQIVGRLFARLRGPVSKIVTAAIPAELAGWQFCDVPPLTLEPGIAHACLDVPDTVQVGSLHDRAEDSNAGHHVYILAMYDLCWGDDQQWLKQTSAESRYISHDHGFYLPPGGPGISVQPAHLDVAHEYSDKGDGLDETVIEKVASLIDALSQSDIVSVMAAGIPQSWPITDNELETVGHCILHRAPGVAARLRARIPKSAKEG